MLAAEARPIAVAGRGVSGALALYAAILDPRIEHVVLLDPPETHAVAPVFLNVLRYTDLPEAAALVAPRRVTFYARMPPAYEYSRHVWALYGKSAEMRAAVKIPWE
jgi:pimeloyl-ACP methyl ester carboxylesterase